MKLTLISLFLLTNLSFAQSWQQASDGFFTVETSSPTDEVYLGEVFQILQEAKNDLKRQGLLLPPQITLRIHPDLPSFLEATATPWFIAGISDRTRALIQVQRLEILRMRSSLEITLRHELYHLAQAQDWPRWLAEGRAMLFAGETPQAAAFEGLTEERLERMLASPKSAEELQRAMATAYQWVKMQKH